MYILAAMNRSPSGYRVHDSIVSEITECIVAAMSVRSSDKNDDEKQKVYGKGAKRWE